ncbi:GNAT family N-acetyltransferase [Brachybacterium muris]|uniref:Acetyltransferase n=1 Tax=Brachybacterium muris UCD-AY4 TaxID=1249481 RepID=A0A022L1L7_9MICO|nr:GNAT family N-acetyltransferase [Brachybacterium muris]EYT49727.1 acetyltransferase [Brachybacterium muris UCD-AY4]MCT1432043.1 GNAT family N-acetyltransferase [Brachybacterium muris]
MTPQLRAPRPEDEAALRRLHAQFQQEAFDFLLADGDHWDSILAEIDRQSRGVDLPPGRVRAEFLVAEAGGVIVGRTSIRYALTDFLREVGGHVGYAVAPEFRRRGHATEILRLSVERLAGAGVDRVLVTCDDTNLGSIRTIERCGGVLEDVRDVGGSVPKRRYWIEAAGAGQSLN